MFTGDANGGLFQLKIKNPTFNGEKMEPSKPFIEENKRSE